jgi:hypothetical protein
MEPKYSCVFKVFLTTILLLSSCSKETTKSPMEVPNGYLSPKYEDKSYEDVSMDICFPYPQYELIPGSDTTHFQTLVEFDKSFKEYFPEGIMLFSTIKEVGWVFFEVNYADDIIEYNIRIDDDLDYYLLLPDSLTKFQRESDANFLFVPYFSAFTNKPPDSTMTQEKYSTTYEIEYAIWDRKNLELVTKDKVKSTIEFDRLVDNWPYRDALTKSAALIFEKLPMFEK